MQQFEGPQRAKCLYRSSWPRAPSKKPEPPAQTSSTPPFTTTQFHVLLNSLFKVLFNFPSRYLFAIGLRVIFSLTWSLPGTLSCTPKQLDSKKKSASKSNRLTGLSPSMGHGPSHGGLGLVAQRREDSPKHHMSRDENAWDSVLGYSRFIRHY